jgi:AcrR family transcriptional regulator
MNKVTQTQDPSVEPERRREPISRDRVIEAALRIMDTEGLEAVTMRRVGRELGVEAMSLYHHVKDKEDILDGIVEQVMSEFDPPASGGDWREDARIAAGGWREMLTRHPNVMTLMADRHKPLANPTSVRPMDTALGILRRAGLSPRDTAQAFQAFGGFIMGFVMMEQGMMFGHDDGDADHQQEMEAFSRMLAGGDLPYLQEALPILHECATDDLFEFGLDLLIRGVESRAS